MRLIALLAVVLALACGETTTIPYTRYIGLTGTYGLTTVNGKPLPSHDTGAYLNALYVLDSGSVILDDSTFIDHLYYTLILGDSIWPTGDTLSGKYYAIGNSIRFHPSSAPAYSMAWLDSSKLVQIYGDGHTLIYTKRP